GSGNDIDTLTSDSIRANWGQAQDPHSGLDHYAYAVDSVPGDSGIIGWTNTSDSSMSQFLSNPVDGTTYYSSLRAWNNAGLMAGDTTSDGVLYLEPSGLQEEAPIGELKLYPSPLEKGERLRLRIRSERPLTLRTALYDARGRLLLRKELDLSSGTSIRSYDQGMTSGVHHLKVSGDRRPRPAFCGAIKADAGLPIRFHSEAFETIGTPSSRSSGAQDLKS
ncbi:MAG: hypothetical protein ABEH38_09940, partial [Flavobacteriales bacterium]